jgi:putative transposase
LEKLGMASYPSSMTDSEWVILEALLPPKPDTFRGRPQAHSRRSIIDGILYIIRTGGAWRMMPNDLPNWKTCYHYFRLWAKLGHWERIHTALRDMARLASGKKKPRPLRLSIVKAFGQLASPEFVVMMRVRKLQEENDIYW